VLAVYSGGSTGVAWGGFSHPKKVYAQFINAQFYYVGLSSKELGKLIQQ